MLGRGHQPERHLRHDAEIALRKEPGRIRAERILVLAPRRSARHRAHPGPQELAVRQHDLETVDRAGMVAVVAEREAKTAVERITERAAPAGIRAVDPDVEPALLDVAI